MAKQPVGEDGRLSFTVSEFGEVLNGLLDESFEQGVWVEGEIENCKPARPHLYFTLAERGDVTAQLDIKIWQSALSRLKPKLATAGIELKNGLKVRLLGKPDFYAPFGKLSFLATDIDTRFTLGEIALKRDELIRKLKESGATARNGRLPLPLVPLRLGVVSSAQAAGWADARKHLAESGYAFDIKFCDVKVQGEQAPHQIVAALRTLGARSDIDIILLMRGGGSKGDLAAFDDESIAMAIVNSPLPVFTGIGHEIDRSVADEVAHTACKTPTACADEIIALVAEFEERVLEANRGVLGSIGVAIERSRTRLARAVDRVKRQPRLILERKRLEIENKKHQVRLLDPAITMARGWSITRTVDGRVVTDVGRLKVGERIITTIANGTVTSSVEETS